MVPVDGRRSSTVAEEYVVSLGAKAPVDSVVVLTVVDTKELDGHGIDPGLKESVLATKKKFSEKALSDSIDFFRNSSVEAERRLLVGDPAKLICRTAEEEECDLIVIAESSGGELREWFIGSTTKSVLYQSAVPVVLVKRPRE